MVGKLGLGITDVNIVNMDTAQAYQALQAKQCDAVSLNVPTFFDAENDGMVQVGNLADLGTLLCRYGSCKPQGSGRTNRNWFKNTSTASPKLVQH